MMRRVDSRSVRVLCDLVESASVFELCGLCADLSVLLGRMQVAYAARGLIEAPFRCQNIAQALAYQATARVE